MCRRFAAVDARNRTCEAPVSEMRGDRDAVKVSTMLALKLEQEDMIVAAYVGGS